MLMEIPDFNKEIFYKLLDVLGLPTTVKFDIFSDLIQTKLKELDQELNTRQTQVWHKPKSIEWIKEKLSEDRDIGCAADMKDLHEYQQTHLYWHFEEITWYKHIKNENGMTELDYSVKATRNKIEATIFKETAKEIKSKLIEIAEEFGRYKIEIKTW